MGKAARLEWGFDLVNFSCDVGGGAMHSRVPNAQIYSGTYRNTKSLLLAKCVPLFPIRTHNYLRPKVNEGHPRQERCTGQTKLLDRTVKCISSLGVIGFPVLQ